MSKVSIYFVWILLFIYVKQRKEAYTDTKYIYMYNSSEAILHLQLFFMCVFFRNTRHRHREGSPLKNKWFFITFRKSFGNPEPLPFFPHPPPTHDQSSLWNVTNSILLEKKSNKLPWQDCWRSLWKMLQKEEQTVCVHKPEYWCKKKKLYSFILVIVT